jgi:hypothetical protein
MERPISRQEIDLTRSRDNRDPSRSRERERGYREEDEDEGEKYEGRNNKEVAAVFVDVCFFFAHFARPDLM